MNVAYGSGEMSGFLAYDTVKVSREAEAAMGLALGENTAEGSAGRTLLLHLATHLVDPPQVNPSSYTGARGSQRGAQVDPASSKEKELCKK